MSGVVGPARSQSNTPATSSPSKQTLYGAMSLWPISAGPRYPQEPPRAGMAEPGNCLVEAACPRRERVDLARRQQRLASIDDAPGQEGKHLTTLVVESQHPRSVLNTRGKEIEKGMHRRRPRAHRPVHRAANPPRATQIARQPHRLPRSASAGIAHVSSIGCPRFPTLAGSRELSTTGRDIGSEHRSGFSVVRR